MLATSSQGILVRPPPPIQLASRPIHPARCGHTPGPTRIAVTRAVSPGPPSILDVVDVAAAAAVAVEDLVVEHLESDVDLGHSWPTFVRIIKGIADSATAMMMNR